MTTVSAAFEAEQLAIKPVLAAGNVAVAVPVANVDVKWLKRYQFTSEV